MYPRIIISVTYYYIYAYAYNYFSTCNSKNFVTILSFRILFLKQSIFFKTKKFIFLSSITKKYMHNQKSA